MANKLKYKDQIAEGNTVHSWQVSQSIDAFTGTEDYDITISGSLTLTGSAYLDKNKILSTEQEYILTYNNTTGQIFKATTSSLSGDSTVYKTGSNNNNIIPSKFGTFDNTGINSVIASGDNNKISSNCSFIGGGLRNTASSACSFIGGGCLNSTSGSRQDFIGGGRSNIICTFSDYYSCNNIIVGGQFNIISSSLSDYYHNSAMNFIGGGTNNTISSNYNQKNSIVGGQSNSISNGYSSFIGGGQQNEVGGRCAVIVGGYDNNISPYCAFSFIGGGCKNTVTGKCSGILGGINNTVSCTNSFIIGSNITANRTCTTYLNNLHTKGTSGGNSVIILDNLPTSNPGVTGQLWNDSGTLKIS